MNFFLRGCGFFSCCVFLFKKQVALSTSNFIVLIFDMEIEFNPFDIFNSQILKEELPLDDNQLVNELRNLWRNRFDREHIILDPQTQLVKEEKEKLYRRELRYVTQMYTVFKVCPTHFRNPPKNIDGFSDGEEEYFEYSEPNWNNLKEYSRSKNTGRKRGRPKKESFVLPDPTPPKYGMKGRPKGSNNKKSNWLIKCMKWDLKAENIKTPRQYYKFLRKEYPLKSFKNNEYKITKKQWKLKKHIVKTHLEIRLIKKIIA